MNGTECENMAASLGWSDPANIISLAILLFIILLVISGNSLVIAAVFCSNKLRSVTNYLIVNLAIADLLVGLTVLPFSAIWEVFKIWIFGDVWCRMWLAVDVWMCTASILNLCAISLDRYVAVTRPVAYPSIMSTKRAKSLIAGVWVLSFVICFPPLVGWKDQKSIIQSVYTRENYTRFYTTTVVSVQRSVQLKQMQQLRFPSNRTHMSLDATPDILMSDTEGFNYQDPAQESLESGEYIESSKFFYEKSFCSLKCELTNDRGYVLYSALGSFYIPMFVMLFFYWRIYKAAVRTTRAIKQGFKTTKGSKSIGSHFEEKRLTLRIHRGRGTNQHDSTYSSGSTQSTTTTLGTPSPERLSKYTTRRSHNPDKIKISVSYASTESINEFRGGESTGSGEHRLFNSGSTLYAVHYNSVSGSETIESELFPQQSKICYLQVDNERRQSNTSDITHQHAMSFMQQHQPYRSKKIGRRNFKTQVKRFRTETKATKTLAIIVGLFIFCWLPFFTIYIIRAFCQDCIDPILFSILFWLGYCNSAINPMIYALFSKDFRSAFKVIICHCSFSQESISLKSSRRGSDISSGRFRDRTPSRSQSALQFHSLGGESEMHSSEQSSVHR